MRIGIVSKWFNSGQGTVCRQLRSGLDELGHETFVLARPGRGRRAQGGARRVDRSDPVWDQPGLTEASAHRVPREEYERWATANALDAVFLDNNYQFEEIATLRRLGVRTIGRFVWEHFSADDVPGALEAYDVVYSLTRCEQGRYRELGIESPYVTWGCHPELRSVEAERDADRVTYVFPGSFVGKRKPLREVLAAFHRVGAPSLRLLVTAQLDRDELRGPLGEAANDSRIELLVEDQPTADHLRTFASSDVCLSPSLYEGLGVPLFEATGLGIPAITNDAPPMNEVVTDQLNGILVRSYPAGAAGSGIPAYAPDVDDLTRAIERLADPAERERLAEGARQVRDGERSWERTLADLERLLALPHTPWRGRYPVKPDL